MLYNIIKYLHILSASLLIGGNGFIFFHYKNFTKEVNFFLKPVLVLALVTFFTGFYLMHIAGFGLDEVWISQALILAIINLFIAGYSLYKPSKRLFLLSFFGWCVILFLMVTKIDY
ncbi:MAG: hypothetical protein J0H68_06815 [Sphingobacteriia bacterium]|nr:hypothetical protein [Sphingobacteriia bacterium]